MNLRERVMASLPAGAFLRRDRGGALYVTDAPRFGAWRAPDGFHARIEGQIAKLYPEPALFTDCAFEPDALSEELARFRGAPADDAMLALLISGVKLLEAPDAAGLIAYDRRIRQAAAVAMRAGGGAGLHTAARIAAEIRRRLGK
ncbi:MAG: hypothetical protein ACOYI5_09945 [Christensenellales bacterium]